VALLKFLFPLLFIGFTLGELGKIRLQDNISLGILDILVLLIILVWILFIKKTRHQLKTPIILFIGACIISLLFNVFRFSSSELFEGSLYLVRWGMYAGIYFVIVDVGHKFKNSLINYMLLSGIGMLLIGFIQYFIYNDLKNLYYLGWDDHMFRLFSSYLDPNFAGTFFVLYLIFLFVIRIKFKLNKKITYLFFLLMILTFAAIILTYSRSALLTLGASTIIYSLIKKNFKILTGLIVAFIVILIILSPKFYIVNTNLLRFPSLGQRIESTKQALVIYSKSPVFGVGFNNYRFAREKYIQRDWVPYPSHASAGSDNSFAFILATTGIPGIIAFLFLLYKMFKLGFINIKKNIYSLVFVVSLGGLILNSLLLNSLFYSFIMVWIWILAGLMESKKRL